ncbi:MAG TPA: hypothetical protein VLJ68_03010, partial [Chitinophagaceae bacterium]|nr:hypothetical protein [Chitinophagaceae bacterium]
MKYIFIFPLAVSLMFSSVHHKTFFWGQSTSDTTLLPHQLDGKTDEWPGSRFLEDKETGISYAYNNDAHYLYVVARIPRPGFQSSIIHTGMKLYIDGKGKKKKNLGIE